MIQIGTNEGELQRRLDSAHAAVDRLATDLATERAEHGLTKEDVKKWREQARVALEMAQMMESSGAARMRVIESKAEQIGALRDELAALRSRCEGLVARWNEIGERHGVRTFTGNDHKLFANELRCELLGAGGKANGS